MVYRNPCHQDQISDLPAINHVLFYAISPLKGTVMTTKSKINFTQCLGAKNILDVDV